MAAGGVLGKSEEFTARQSRKFSVPAPLEALTPTNEGQPTSKRRFAVCDGSRTDQKADAVSVFASGPVFIQPRNPVLVPVAQPTAVH